MAHPGLAPYEGPGLSPEEAHKLALQIGVPIGQLMAGAAQPRGAMPWAFQAATPSGPGPERQGGGPPLPVQQPPPPGEPGLSPDEENRWGVPGVATQAGMVAAPPPSPSGEWEVDPQTGRSQKRPALSPGDEAQWGVPGVAKQAGRAPAPSGELSPEDQAQWGGPGTASSKDLPQPLANPKPSGLSAEEQSVLDAQDQQRQGALLGDLQKFQGYQKNNQAWADSQATGQPGPGYQWPPSMDTVGSGDTGGQFPDVSHQARGNELMRLLGMPVPSQQGSDAYLREKYASKQADIEGRRGKLLESSKGPMSPLQQQDLLRQYNQLGLEESQGPDPAASPPALQVLSGSQPSLYTFPGAAQQALVTPGTPQYEERERAGMARGALGEALHAMPAWLQLEGHRIQAQGQQDALGHQSAERAAAANLNRAPEEQSGAQAAIKDAQELARQLSQANRMGGPQGEAAAAAAQKAFEEKAAKRNETLANIPDADEMKKLKSTLEGSYTLDSLLTAIQGNRPALRHGPTRKMIYNAIQSQAGKGVPNLATMLENDLVKQMVLSGQKQLGEVGQPVGVPNVGPGVVTVERNPGGIFHNNYTVRTPGRPPRSLAGSVLPFGDASGRSNFESGRARALQRGEGLGELLKLLQEHGYKGP